jgi:hypothetical protein
MASASAPAPRSLRSAGASLTRLDCSNGDEGLHYAFIGDEGLHYAFIGDLLLMSQHCLYFCGVV